ncbi:MAG: hypothetical protein HYY23_05770 [Verrucomicrobia bacterium]|nr:hypothetical protein [Verrucomicrobiota bacterium]
MKRLNSLVAFLPFIWAFVVVGWLCVGCASTPKADWNSRIGNYTYDQAVLEMGPPNKSTKLTDGTTVADWFIKPSSGLSFGVGTGFYGRHSAVSVGQSIGTSPSGSYWRLTFAPDGKLSQWERVRH